MMKDCYELITDQQEFDKFVEFLPDLQDNEVFFVALLARKKNAAGLIKTNGDPYLVKTVCTKNTLQDTILNLEIPVGRYKHNGIPLPNDAVAIYINPNPRSIAKAIPDLGKKMWDFQHQKNIDLPREVLSFIQNSSPRRIFTDFDIDDDTADLKLLRNIFPSDKCYNIIQTKNGYHIIVDSRELEKFPEYTYSSWYIKISNGFKVDRSGDMITPIPGCNQGGFTPRMIALL